MRTIVLSAALVLAPFVVSSQQRPAPVDTPIFRAGVDLVTVDASVLDDEGRPIEGLSARDFELRVDGKPRPVASVQFVAISREVPSAEDAPRPAHYSTNEHAASGRLILFAVDQDHIRPAEGRAALRAAAERTAGPLVRAALRATAERSAGDRRAAAACACCDSACGDAAALPSRFSASRTARERFGDGVPPSLPF